MRDISNGICPGAAFQRLGGAAWSTEDFRAVLRAIVSSPHAAVTVTELEAVLGFALLGGGGAAAKLWSMTRLNMLVRRAYDPLARDIDAAAFGPGREDVYTLPTAAHVQAARRKLNNSS
jgi:hypothetical protein